MGDADSAGLPALVAATSTGAAPGGFFGPSGPGHMGGAPGAQRLYRPLRNPEDARRIWRLSEDATAVAFPVG